MEPRQALEVPLRAMEATTLHLAMGIATRPTVTAVTTLHLAMEAIRQHLALATIIPPQRIITLAPRMATMTTPQLTIPTQPMAITTKTQHLTTTDDMV